MRILIADDDEIMLDLLANALMELGHEVQTAANGREALDLIDKGNYRLVISDWEMPVMDGLELCRQIRARDDSGYVYTILLTAIGSKGTVEGLTAGADDFITKPFDPAELAVRIRVGQRILGLETRDLTIFALAKLAESRDPETGAHLERVRNYCRILARQLGHQEKYKNEIDSAYVRLIYLTSPLHDIGKVAIPDSVLLKPGRLSDHEFEMMKTHTTMGAQTLEAALREHPEAGFLRMAVDIAATHHERFDGTGYPQGLHGMDIPLAGRIVALADVYDALTSRRVYKGAFGHDVSRSMIFQESGSHFDPDVVEAFKQCEAEFAQIHESHHDAQTNAEPTAA